MTLPRILKQEVHSDYLESLSLYGSPASADFLQKTHFGHRASDLVNNVNITPILERKLSDLNEASEVQLDDEYDD